MSHEENNTASSTHNHSEVNPQQQRTSNTRQQIRSKRPTSLKLYKVNAQQNKSSTTPPQPQGNILEQLSTTVNKRNV
jgi:hypothetical protein